MDHVEECPSYYVECWGDDELLELHCICDRLRAAEQRVEESMDRAWSQTVQLAVAHTRTATLDAAREAVAEFAPSAWIGLIRRSDAILVIDALRKDAQ